MKTLCKSLLGSLFISMCAVAFAAQAHASAPFGDSFDTYQPGSLYAQGMWQTNIHTWQVTDQGCYGNAGKCIVSTGLNGDNFKAGTDLAQGEWRVRFYVRSSFGASYVGTTIFLGSSAVTQQTDVSFRNDTATTTKILDNQGNIVASGISQGQWHTLVYTWNMSDQTNCSFLIHIDNGPDVPTSPSGGNASNCYNNAFPQHTIGGIDLFNYYVSEGQVLLDDLGDGPVVDGCLTNCSGPVQSQITDSFDSFNAKGWTAPSSAFNTLTLFRPEPASSGNCHSGNCLAADGGVGYLDTGAYMYLESGVGKESGAFTIWARARLGNRLADAIVGLCVSQWTNCSNGYLYQFDYVVPTDDTWHQVYIAWRQGATNLEACKLVDSTDQTLCIWRTTPFLLGTQIDGVLLIGSTYRSTLGDQVWFDDLEDASSAPICTVDCNSNVMFLPGAEATNLYASGSLTENHIWPPNSVAGQDVTSLDLTNPDAVDNVYTKEKDIIGKAYVTTNVYQPFIDQMDTLVTNKTIAEWEPIAYDWRLDYNDLLTKGNVIDGKIYYRGINASTTNPYIIRELKRLALSSRTKKVTIVAHSNGGLLAKALIQYLGTTTASQLIDKLILVETPQVGTPEAIAGLLHGYDQALPNSLFHPFLSDPDARALAINTPAVYNLLPTNQYFTFTDNSVITFNPQSIPEWIAQYGDINNPSAGIHSTTLLRNFMTDISRGTPDRSDTATPAIANATLVDNATKVHSLLDGWVSPAGIQFITIAGWGNETLSNIEYTKAVTGCVLNTSNGCAVPIYGNQVTFNPHVVIDGDGTVVDSSAQWANGATTSVRYWLNLEKYNCPTILTCKPQTGLLSSSRTSHAFVFTVPQLNTFLNNILTNTAAAPTDLITTSRPAYSGDEPRLHFTLHSPLTLGFTDSSGNYSGSTATSTLFNVPGVDYQRIGEVQWLSVPKGLAGQVLLRGTASGSFTLGVESVNGNSIVATTTFAAVSSATSTVAKLTIDSVIDPAVSSTLQVDYNGDGIVDQTLQAKQGGIILPDVTAPEAVISASTSTKDLAVTGLDDVSPTTTATKTATTTTITDQSGNKTTLFFQKTFSGNLLTYARLAGISYGTTTIPLPASFLYVWNASKTLISQRIVAENIFMIQALYNKNLNKTTIIVMKKHVPIQKTTVTGLAIIKLTTNKGMVNYSW